MDFINIEPLEKAKDLIADIIGKQIEAGNMSNRYNENPKALTDTVNYCAMIASLMIGHVLNKGYFPQLTDRTHHNIKHRRRRAKCCLSLCYGFKIYTYATKTNST